MINSNNIPNIRYFHLLIHCLLLAILFFAHPAFAQDIPPMKAPQDLRHEMPQSITPFQHTDLLVSVPEVEIPDSFENMGNNTLIDTHHSLYPFFEQLKALRQGTATSPARILQVGDSHIFAHILSRNAGDVLKAAFGDIVFDDMGHNGATTSYFNKENKVEQMAAFQPDLLILSFGTNESHNLYRTDTHYGNMEKFVALIRTLLPNTPILLTTPPGSFVKFKFDGRKYEYRINATTPTTVQTIIDFGKDQGLAVWDMYNLFGGVRSACRNWYDSGLMRPDHVHFTPDGYALQGRMMAQSLLQAYNQYVSTH